MANYKNRQENGERCCAIVSRNVMSDHRRARYNSLVVANLFKTAGNPAKKKNRFTLKHAHEKLTAIYV
jgi:hypothetical protein